MLDLLYKHKPLAAFGASSGPKSARLALVGEAWGREEALVGLPFVGAAGQELTRELAEAGIDRKHVFLTNVLAFQPQNNDLRNVSCQKGQLPVGYDLPPLGLGQYLMPEYLPELDRLKEELEAVRPNLVVALGATASWALMSQPKISKVRGTIAPSTLIRGLKVLPTFHPAYVLRQYSGRVICIVDYMKAKRQMEFPEIRRPKRRVLVDPRLEDIDDFADEARTAPLLSVDIETEKGQITMVGFAHRTDEALVVPFVDHKQRNFSYWATPTQEQAAWSRVKALLESPIPKLFQNGLFDLQYLRRMGMRVQNVVEDTMLMSHALYPEMPKALGFLGSIHTDEPAWKLMRVRGQEELKRDE